MLKNGFYNVISLWLLAFGAHSIEGPMFIPNKKWEENGNGLGDLETMPVHIYKDHNIWEDTLEVALA
jgi:hypothetical protein